MGGDGYVPLFETKEAKGRIPYKVYAISIFVGITLMWVYRATHIPSRLGIGIWAWFGMFGAEVWFGLCWILMQSVRWNPVSRHTFKDRLSQRYKNELPGVDIFVCTANHTIEPPSLVINTILSVMAYDYPSDKLAVYLSDDGGSDLMFYALLEASHFSKHWIPFCKKFKVETMSPAAYFAATPGPHDDGHPKHWLLVKKLYENMENRIETAVNLGRIPEEISAQHKGFSEWNSGTNPHDHQAIVQILIDGRDPNAADREEFALPTLVYLSREKRPKLSHNFKAGALNALIRVSSEITNGQIILNVDCDMYANNSNAVRDALCFFMDEEKGHEIGFVQFPQCNDNITKNDIYACAFRVINEVEVRGLDGWGGPFYLGTGCFHRRESLCGSKYRKGHQGKWNNGGFERNAQASTGALEERAVAVAGCTYEANTQWGKEMGLKYGCPGEDLITGLAIQCRGWKSIYFSPTKEAFLGVAPTTLVQSLVQHKRWGEGQLQIFLSEHCPVLYGHGKIKLGLQLGYCNYNLWALNSFPTLCYVVIPSLCLLNGISLFPEISSPWTIPFAYVFIVKYAYSLAESLWIGETTKGWWNMQRMWILRRISSYLFSVADTALKLLGFAETAFTVTPKVADDEVLERYEQEMMEFGSSFPMFTIIATLAMVNLLCLIGSIKRVAMDDGVGVAGQLILQLLLCGLLVMINIPIYQGMFLRRDKGCMPTSIVVLSTALALLACVIPIH